MLQIALVEDAILKAHTCK